MIEIRYTPVADYAASGIALLLRSLFRRGNPGAGQLRFFLSGLLLITLGGAYAAVFGSLFCGLIPALGIFLFAWIFWQIERFWAAEKLKLQTANPQEHFLRLASDYLEVLLPSGVRTRVRRPALRCWRESESHFALLIEGVGEWHIPKAAFNTIQIEGFRSWLNARPFESCQASR